MDWNQDEMATAVAAAVPIAASTVGVVTALVSWSTSARLKRRAEMLRSEIGAASLPHDVAILRSLHRATTARIVARTAVPASKTLGLVMLIPAGMLVPLLSGFFGLLAYSMLVLGVLDRGTDFQRDFFYVTAAASVFTLIGSYMLMFCVAEPLKSLLERQRMEALYLNGQDLDRSMSRSTGFPTVESLEPLADGGKNTAARIHRRLRVTVWTATLGFGLLAWCYGILLAGVLFELQTDTLFMNYLAPIGLVVGLIDVLIMPAVIVTGFNQVPDDWVHPRPPSPVEQIQDEIAAAQRGASPRRGRWWSGKRSTPGQP